jgi:hypothetical protein
MSVIDIYPGISGKFRLSIIEMKKDVGSQFVESAGTIPSAKTCDYVRLAHDIRRIS